MKPHYKVVAAAIIRDGRILCTQKGQTKYPYTSFKWEFPGGKIEEGETPEQALRRELIEEMAYSIEVGKHLTTVNHEYPDFKITLSVYMCTPVSDTFTLKEHAAFRWTSREDLAALDWVAADADIIKLLSGQDV